MRAELKALIYKAVLHSKSLHSDDDKKALDELMKEAFGLADTPEEKKEAGRYLMDALKNQKRHDVDAKLLMDDVLGALSLSYIAKNYFDRDKSWLYQRMNNSVVNGKPVAFTNSELKILADALGDLGQRLSALSTVIHRSL